MFAFQRKEERNVSRHLVLGRAAAETQTLFMEEMGDIGVFPEWNSTELLLNSVNSTNGLNELGSI